MPNVDALPNGTVPTTVIFKIPSTDQPQERIFRGINTQLIDDVNGDGIVDSPDELVAAKVNGKEVTLNPGEQYIAQIGDKNRGFSLETGK